MSRRGDEGAQNMDDAGNAAPRSPHHLINDPAALRPPDGRRRAPHPPVAPLLGAIEGGGTKFVLLAGRGPDDVLRRTSISTTLPSETIAACVAFFREVQRTHDLAAVGVGMFGPVDLDRQSPSYGYITTTPKEGWQQTDVIGPLERALGVHIGWAHDVTAALLGERRWGAAANMDPAIYMTVGTGVGASVYVNGAPLHGLLHPEMGHLLMPALPGDDFAGVCPFHGRCLEGLVSGPAIERRAGRPAAEVPPDSPIWQLVAEYLAVALMNYSLILSPRRIVIGGGVLHQTHLLPFIRTALRRRLAGYLQHPLLLERLDEYVVPSALGDDAGILGALELARIAADATTTRSATGTCDRT